DVEAAAVGKLQIEHHHVRLERLHLGQPVRSGGRAGDLVAAIGQHSGERPGDRGLVVDDQDSLLHPFRSVRSPETGNDNRKVAPPPDRFLILIRPPCSRTICRLMLSPNPVPFGRVVKKGSKILSNTSSGIPHPLSWNATSTACLVR